VHCGMPVAWRVHIIQDANAPGTTPDHSVAVCRWLMLFLPAGTLHRNGSWLRLPSGTVSWCWMR
jgi:hypothetical protein